MRSATFFSCYVILPNSNAAFARVLPDSGLSQKSWRSLSSVKYAGGDDLRCRSEGCFRDRVTLMDRCLWPMQRWAAVWQTKSIAGR
jgi:hypothetical protein